jgi:hypothetical protein
MTDNALAVRDYDPTDLAPRFVVSLEEMRRQISELDEFKRSIMIKDVDYGDIPGTHKPTLLKPGAEKLCMVFGLAPTFESVTKVEEWERGFFHYDERCVLTNKRNGMVVASANGSANSKETRYRWRDSKPVCPGCGFELKRQRDNDGFYCWRKIGGCGAEWRKEQIGAAGRIENPEPYELVNTIKKMAQKRALVAATLIATGGSGYFTQDVEDLTPATADDDNVIEVQPRTVVQPTPIQQNRPRTAPVTGTDTKCARCDKVVESAALLKDSQSKYSEPLCVKHFNERGDAD